MSDVLARTCPSCAQPVPVESRFCRACGAEQPLPPAPPSAETKVPWHAGEALLVFVLNLVATGVVIYVLAGPANLTDDAVTVWAIIANELLLIALTVVWVRARHGLGLRALGVHDVTIRSVGLGMGIGLLGLVATALVTSIVLRIIEAVGDGPVETPQQIELSADPSTAMLVVIGLGVVVLAPIAEELFFRGFLLAGLRRFMRLWPAVLISAALFAVVHIYPLVIPAIFVLGVILAVLVERRRSIVPAIAAHMTFNAAAFTVLVLDESLTAGLLHRLG